MDFTTILKDLISQVSVFAQGNPFMALAILLILAYLIYRKPLFFISIFILGLVLISVLYLILSISTPGRAEKEKLIQRGSKPEISFRKPGMML